MVDNGDATSAPVIYEPSPTHPNVIGRIEHRAEMGTLVTDFSMVRAGALLQANGGYLILDVRRVLTMPFVWEALKQALWSRQARIESPGESYGFVSTTTLKPEPIPLDIKVILIGERWLYYLLSHYDQEFGSLFKVAADIDDAPGRRRDKFDLRTPRIAHYSGAGGDSVAFGTEQFEADATVVATQQRNPVYGLVFEIGRTRHVSSTS